MLIAKMVRKDGRNVLVLGLMERNMELLRNDQPIRRELNGADGSPAIEGLEDWVVFVLGPEDTARFVAEVRATAPPEGSDL